MKRHFLAGSMDRHGIARPFRGCTCDSNQGRSACTCETELANELGPDDERVIQPPRQTPEDRAAIARVRRNTLALVLAGFSVLATLLGIADWKFTP